MLDLNVRCMYVTSPKAHATNPEPLHLWCKLASTRRKAVTTISTYCAKIRVSRRTFELRFIQDKCTNTGVPESAPFPWMACSLPVSNCAVIRKKNCPGFNRVRTGRRLSWPIERLLLYPNVSMFKVTYAKNKKSGNTKVEWIFSESPSVNKRKQKCGYKFNHFDNCLS